MPTVVDVLETRLDLTNLSAYQSRLGKAADSIQKWGAVSLAGAAVAVKSSQLIGAGLQEATSDAEAFGRASGNFKGDFPVDDIAKFSGEMQKLTTVADDQVAGFLGLLGTFKLTGNEAKSLALPILNASKALEAQGVTADQLAVQVGKAIQGGNDQALRRSGIFVDKAKFAVDRLGALKDALESQGGDAALAFAKTDLGKIESFKRSVEDLEGAVGEKFLPALTKGIDLANSFIETLNNTKGGATAAAVVLGVTLVGGIVAANAGTIALVYNLYKLRKAHEGAAVAAVEQAAAEKLLGGASGTAAVANTAKTAAQAAGAANTAVQAGKAAAGTATAVATGKAVQKLNLGQKVVAAVKAPVTALAAALGLKKAADTVAPVVNVAAPAAKAVAGTGATAGAAEAIAAGAAAKAVAGIGIKGLLGAALKFAGPVGVGLGAADLINIVPTGGNKQGEGVKTVAKDTAIGAGIGAGIGALFAGVGALPGGLIGGALGAATGLATEAMRPQTEAKKTEPIGETEAQKQTRLMEAQLAALKALGNDKPVNFAGLSIVQQRGIMDAARRLA